jgi:hypothetical protein
VVHSVCNSGSVTYYTHTFYGEKDERCGLETAILTIPNWDSIRNADVSSRLFSLYCDPTITAACSLILYNPAEFWGPIHVFEKCDACLSGGGDSNHILILTAIQWTKRRGPRHMTNMNIFVLLWYLPYAKRSKWRSDESRQIKVSPYFAVYYTKTQNFGIIMQCEQSDHFQEPGRHITCYSRQLQPRIAENMETLRTSEMTVTLRPLTAGSSSRAQF